MTHRIHPCASGFLALALTMLALSTSAVPALARTFDFNSTGSMVQQPLPPGFACAMRRAMVNRRIPCQGIYGQGDVLPTRTPVGSQRWARSSRAAAGPHRPDR
jgi:hypothetical protein